MNAFGPKVQKDKMCSFTIINALIFFRGGGGLANSKISDYLDPRSKHLYAYWLLFNPIYSFFIITLIKHILRNVDSLEKHFFFLLLYTENKRIVNEKSEPIFKQERTLLDRKCEKKVKCVLFRFIHDYEWSHLSSFFFHFTNSYKSNYLDHRR